MLNNIVKYYLLISNKICYHLYMTEQNNKKMKTYPLLQSQLGVFYDCLKYPQVMQYNIPCITKLTDDIDLDCVEKAIQAIFAARPELSMLVSADAMAAKPQQVPKGFWSLTGVI